MYSWWPAGLGDPVHKVRQVLRRSGHTGLPALKDHTWPPISRRETSRVIIHFFSGSGFCTFAYRSAFSDRTPGPGW